MDFDKLLHAGCFGFLAFLISVGMRFSGRAYSIRLLFLVPFLFSTLYGASDEFHQYFIPHRVHDFWDWIADLFGALVVSGALALWWRSRDAQATPHAL